MAPTYSTDRGCDPVAPLLQAAGLTEAPSSSQLVDCCWCACRCAANSSLVDTAVVASHVYNAAELFSWKSGLAVLQRAWEEHCGRRLQGALRTIVLQSVEELKQCCHAGFLGSQQWVLKDALANSAAAVWIICRQNWRAVAVAVELEYREGEVELVLQEYLNTPSLYRGRKFHWRVYCALTAAHALYIYEMGFMHVANRLYEAGGFDAEAQSGLG